MNMITVGSLFSGIGGIELGLEPTMEAYLDNMMRWIREVWRVLKPTGSFVLDKGDMDGRD